MRTVPRPPESSTTAVAFSVVRTASPARSASSGRAGRQSPPAAGFISTRPRPGLISVMTPAVSPVWAATGSGASASHAHTTTSRGALIGSALLQAQQLADLDRLASAFHRHAAAVPHHHAVHQDREQRAADENAGAEVAIQALDARGRVDGVPEHRVLLLARGAEGARERQ